MAYFSRLSPLFRFREAPRLPAENRRLRHVWRLRRTCFRLVRVFSSSPLRMPCTWASPPFVGLYVLGVAAPLGAGGLVGVEAACGFVGGLALWRLLWGSAFGE